MIKRTLYFVRHGLREDFENPAWKESCGNPWDPPLSANGRGQAADVGAFFADKKIHSIFSSPFLRTLETAQAVAAGCGAQIRTEEGICEWLNPEWHALPPSWHSADTAVKLFPAVDPTYQTMVHARYPETAERIHVRERCRRCLAHILHENPSGNLVFVTHGSPLGQCVDHLLGSLEGIDFSMAAITQIVQQGSKFRLLGSGCGHLRVLDETGRFF
jgi:broad specificity phosphatase PhoE